MISSQRSLSALTWAPSQVWPEGYSQIKRFLVGSPDCCDWCTDEHIHRCLLQTSAGLCCSSQKRHLSEGRTLGLKTVVCACVTTYSVGAAPSWWVVSRRNYLDCGSLCVHISKPENHAMLWNGGWENEIFLFKSQVWNFWFLGHLWCCLP